MKLCGIDGLDKTDACPGTLHEYTHTHVLIHAVHMLAWPLGMFFRDHVGTALGGAGQPHHGNPLHQQTQQPLEWNWQQGKASGTLTLN